MRMIAMPNSRCRLLQQCQHLRLDRHVQRRRGLVGDDEVRFAHQRHGDHHPLPKPAGKLMRILAQPLFRRGDADLAEQIERACRASERSAFLWRR